MASYNKVILIGNVTREIELRQTGKGTAVAELGLAINSSWFDKATNSKKESVVYCDVSLFGRHAEIASEYLSKGRPVMIEGRLQLDTWDDKETGQKRSKLKVVCENLQMLGDGRGNNGGGNQRPQRQASQPASQSEPDSVPFEEVPF